MPKIKQMNSSRPDRIINNFIQSDFESKDNSLLINLDGYWTTFWQWKTSVKMTSIPTIYYQANSNVGRTVKLHNTIVNEAWYNSCVTHDTACSKHGCVVHTCTQRVDSINCEVKYGCVVNTCTQRVVRFKRVVKQKGAAHNNTVMYSTRHTEKKKKRKYYNIFLIVFSDLLHG